MVDRPGAGPSSRKPPSDEAGNQDGSEAPAGPAQLRWIDMTDQQKQDVIRIRNNASAKRSRQRKREQKEKIESQYQTNERRIETLEKMVEILSQELKSSDDGRKKNPKREGSSSKNHPPRQ